MNGSELMLITVCIASYKRPEGLKRLLDGLNRLIFTSQAEPNIEVIIVDNDITASAHCVYAAFQADFRWSLRYCIEAKRGISYARNRGISEAKCQGRIPSGSQNTKNTNFVVFIDDDEIPEPNWLDELLKVQRIHKADVVTGPVIPHFIKSDVPQWILRGGFFERRHYPTGYSVNIAFTNNVLISAHALEGIDKVFDERLALTGGEDVHFFMRLREAGYKFVWADEAAVTEWIPQSRTSIGSILLRGYYGWSVQSMCERELNPSVLGIRAIKGISLIVKGLCLVAPSLFLGQHALVTALLNIYRGVGSLAGIAGVRYQAYKVTHSV
jgi:succinoglycan biosynthesis protein ExoM